MKIKIAITAFAVACVASTYGSLLFDYSTDPTVSGYTTAEQHTWSLNSANHPSFGGGGYSPPPFGSGFYAEPMGSPAFAVNGFGAPTASLVKTTGAGYMAGSSLYVPYVDTWDTATYGQDFGYQYHSIAYGVAGTFALSDSSANSEDSIVVLFKNGGSSSMLSSVSLQLDGVDSEITATHVEMKHLAAGSGQGAYTVDAYQFDVSGETYSSYAVAFSTLGHAALYDIQLETSDAFAAIPEPTTTAFLGLISGVGLLVRRFRFGS